MSFPTADLQVCLVGLWSYPIKSCAGVAVEQATLTRHGISGDREWILVNAQSELVWQGELPRMALVQPSFGVDRLFVDAPGQPRLSVPTQTLGEAVEVKIWNDRSKQVERHAGTAASREADQWFSDFLGMPLRLVRLGAQALQRDAANPLHVLSLPSLAALNAQLERDGHAPVAVERFRPNLLIDGVAYDELSAFGEDQLALLGWPQAIELQLVAPCVRCVMPNVNPRDASLDPHVLDTVAVLSAQRLPGGPVCFGMYAQPMGGGILQRGARGGATIRF
jgi:uncharacterized protein YcbX